MGVRRFRAFVCTKLIAEKFRSEGTEFASVFITFTATRAGIEPWLRRHCHAIAGLKPSSYTALCLLNKPSGPPVRIRKGANSEREG
jgi:hypothetical protein